MTEVSRGQSVRASRGMALFWLITGLIGWVTSFLLFLEWLGQLDGSNHAVVSCTLSVIVSCTPNLLSPAGNLLGFSNSIIGITAFTAPVIVGMATLAGGAFKRWFWALFNVGILGGFCLVQFFAYFSIFVGGHLCPWCMCVWLATIPMFWYTTGWTLKSGVWGSWLKGLGSTIFSWGWVITLAHYALIAVLAEIVLHAIESIFG